MASTDTYDHGFIFAANDNHGIGSASFSVDWFLIDHEQGEYGVAHHMNAKIAVSAPNYQTIYIINPGAHFQFYLTYTGGWPQTY